MKPFEAKWTLEILKVIYVHINEYIDKSTYNIININNSSSKEYIFKRNDSSSIFMMPKIRNDNKYLYFDAYNHKIIFVRCR